MLFCLSCLFSRPVCIFVCFDILFFVNLNSENNRKLTLLSHNQEYEDDIKSHIADLRNIGKNTYGGSIKAALFLKQFVAKMKWAHIDMAAPVWCDSTESATGKREPDSSNGMTNTMYDEILNK